MCLPYSDDVPATCLYNDSISLGYESAPLEPVLSNLLRRSTFRLNPMASCPFLLRMAHNINATYLYLHWYLKKEDLVIGGGSFSHGKNIVFYQLRPQSGPHQSIF